MLGLLLISLTAMIATGPSSGALNLVPSMGKIPPETYVHHYLQACATEITFVFVVDSGGDWTGIFVIER